ncbi:MAG: GNAT family N-acetyltransferase [Casimicrobiaceae bacterium]
MTRAPRVAQSPVAAPRAARMGLPRSRAGGIVIEELADPPPDFLAGEVEGYAFYKAFQDAAIDNFEVAYLRAYRNGIAVATAPIFTTRYRINTTMKGGWLKRLLHPFWLRIACVGHPLADYGVIDGEVSTEVLEAFNRRLATKAPIVSYKDFPAALPLDGFAVEPGLPVAALAIEGDYWSGLRRSVRASLRRRLRKGQALRVEVRDGYPAELGGRIYELYLNVHRHGEFSFELLNQRYFELVGPFSKYALYWEGDTLIGFCLLMCKGERMHAKYLGMDYERGRPYGLYFFMVLSLVELCLRDGYTLCQTGCTTYAFKQRLGSTLHPVFLYYRHRNAAVNWGVRALMARLSVKPHELACVDDAV